MKIQSLSPLFTACLLAFLPHQAPALDLLERYPTSLTSGDMSAERAREWQFTGTDIFRLSRFQFEGDEGLKFETGPAVLGVGHCTDGAVWAAVIPQENGTVTSNATNRESVAHIWLRFHPGDINTLFPPETVSADGPTNFAAQVRAIAEVKMLTSYHLVLLALIPEPGEFVVNVDTASGQRRGFAVDKTVFTPELAAKVFDRIWGAFDRSYAMFELRPEVDWNKSREEFRPRAVASKSTPEFANVCADMLRPLRDLHVWLKIGEKDVPVFDRPRAVNSNPFAHRAIIGELHGERMPVQWAVTPDKIGFIATYHWLGGKGISQKCDEVLEALRDTRALIVDVRLNGGGSEDVAMEFAGRFLANEFTYASHRMRNGPAHTNLTARFSRTAKPRGPWRYDRPVLLLIGQRCISSNEAFVAMMIGATNVTTMGDRTAGSSGNPALISLSLNMFVSVPQWIAYLPDGTPLDERGFQPQIKFEPQPGAFDGDRDDLLSAALERLRKMPLPATPIENE